MERYRQLRDIVQVQLKSLGEKDFMKALKRLEEIFDAKPDTPESDKLEILGTMVDDYENKHHPN